MTLEQRKARLAGMTEAIRERNAPSYPWRETDLMPTAAKRWRKKTTIEAVQWFANGHCPVWAQAAVEEAGDRFTIRTREGVLTGIPGDWIARGIEGEVYPIGPDIFAKTYEPANLSSDARPAPMPEEVKAALGDIRTKAYWLRTEDNENAATDLYRSALTLSTHIDDLTRKVAAAEGLLQQIRHDADLASETGIHDPDPDAEAEIVLVIDAFLAGQPLSRSQETDAVLAEKPAVWRVRVRAGYDYYDNKPTIFNEDIVTPLYAHPSPGPATETERKDGWWEKLKAEISWHIQEHNKHIEAAEYEEKMDTTVWFAEDVKNALVEANMHRLEAQVHGEAADRLSALLASVRPKQEGV